MEMIFCLLEQMDAFLPRIEEHEFSFFFSNNRTQMNVRFFFSWRDVPCFLPRMQLLLIGCMRTKTGARWQMHCYGREYTKTYVILCLLPLYFNFCILHGKMKCIQRNRPKDRVAKTNAWQKRKVYGIRMCCLEKHSGTPV